MSTHRYTRRWFRSLLLSKQIAFEHHSPGCENKIYLVSAQGGTSREPFPGECKQFDPAWSPDGKLVTFVRAEILLRVLSARPRSKLSTGRMPYSPASAPLSSAAQERSKEGGKALLKDPIRPAQVQYPACLVLSPGDLVCRQDLPSAAAQCRLL